VSTRATAPRATRDRRPASAPHSIPTATLDYSAAYDPDRDFDAIYTRATGRRIVAGIAPGARVLELGCATGLMTAQLADVAGEVIAVDRSAPYLDNLRARRLLGVTAVLADVEDYEPAGRFDHIVAANLLHEVGDPGVLLARAHGWLSPGGRIHVTLPNPRSLHRLVALEMGLIDSLDALSARGARFGTRRTLNAEALSALAAAAGLRVRECGGILLKPLPNEAMAALDPAVLEGFERAARHLPDHCAMTYVALGTDDG
jgi:2-polyprenyl-3-methyl-5-hydroxy-6-metoxy-1,4-benzoquinol methylase